MAARMRGSGFTLVEVLVSLLVAVVVLGVSVTGSRVIGQQAQVAQQQLEMGSVADTLINEAKLLEYTGADANINDTGPEYGAVYGSGGSATLAQWGSCGYFSYNGNGHCVAPQYEGTGVQGVNLSDLSLTNGQPVTEVVAISRDPSAVGAPDGSTNPTIADALTPAPAAQNISLSDRTAPWDFYEVSMSLERYSGFGGSGPAFNLDQGFTSTKAQNDLQQNSYLVSVTLQNYYLPSERLTRTATITNWMAEP